MTQSASDLLIRLTGRVSRTLKPPRGRTRLKHFLLRHGPPHDIPYRDSWGLRRLARLTDHMEAQGFVGLESLPKGIRALIRPGQWVVDVGANIGLVTGPLCRLVGPSGRVWAIEPIPRNVQRLEQLRDLNGLNVLHIIPCALGSRPGTASIHVPVGGESGWASFTASWISGESVQVRTERLDDLIFTTPPDRPVSFIKIDVEGFEAEVLLGARRTLTEMRPHVLCEFNDIILRDAGSSAEALIAQFEQIGYEPSPTSLSQARHLQGQVADILMVPA